MSSKEDKERAEKYAQELKRLRNPAILRYVDVQIQEKMLLVTECVVPLESIKESLTYSQLIFSMERVLHALNFLHTKAQVSHNNVCLSVVFMHRDSELSGLCTFKLGGFSYCSNRPSSSGALSTHPQPPESPRDQKSSSAACDLPLHVRDIWHLGFIFPQLLDMNNGVDAVSEMSKMMHEENPLLRPTALQLLSKPFFALDPFLNIITFLQAFRGNAQVRKKDFFNDLEMSLGGISSRDLRESIFPLLTQTDVFAEPEANDFWKRLFEDYAKHFGDHKELDSGILVSDIANVLLPNLITILQSSNRLQKAAILRQIPQLIEIMDPKMVLESVFPAVLECMKDSDSQLCLAAMESSVTLTLFWTKNKNESGLHAVNNEILIQLRALAYDSDHLVRERVVDILARLIILYDRINGMLGIKVIITSLGDPIPSVILSALNAIDKMKSLMTSVVIVHVVLPGLVALLLSKNDEIRNQTLSLVCYLSNLVATAKDRSQWPDVSIKNISTLIGSTQRKNLFHGSTVGEISHSANRKMENGEKSGEKNNDSESDGDEEWDNDKWSAGKEKGKNESLFNGLNLKESTKDESASLLKKQNENSENESSENDHVEPKMILERHTLEAPRSPREDSNVLNHSHSQNSIHSSIGRNSGPDRMESSSSPGEMQVPETPEETDIQDLLAAKNDSESESDERIIFGTVEISDEEEEEEEERVFSNEQNMLDLVIQSQAMRKDILGGSKEEEESAEKIPEIAALPAKFESLAPVETDDSAWGDSAWGADDDIELPE